MNRTAVHCVYCFKWVIPGLDTQCPRSVSGLHAIRNSFASNLETADGIQRRIDQLYQLIDNLKIEKAAMI